MEFKKVITLVVVGGIFYMLGQYIATTPAREITVQGTGEVNAVPDVAAITLGVNTGRQDTAEAATEILTEKITNILALLEKFEVAERDITTNNLSVNPNYDYRDAERRLLGYEATESVRVKVRKLDDVGNIVAAATREGANQVGGVAFEIDDPDKLAEAAQQKAIEDARDNAGQLAKALGVRLGQVISFSTSSGGSAGPIYARATLEALGDEVGGPPVPEGEQDVIALVTITYEIK